MRYNNGSETYEAFLKKIKKIMMGYIDGKTMKIEHIAMYVNDIEAAREFFIKYLDAKSNNGY